MRRLMRMLMESAPVCLSTEPTNAGDQHRPDHSPIQPITSPRAREESMPTLFEFAAMWGILLLTMFLPIRWKRRPIQPQDA